MRMRVCKWFEDFLLRQVYPSRPIVYYCMWFPARTPIGLVVVGPLVLVLTVGIFGGIVLGGCWE